MNKCIKRTTVLAKFLFLIFFFSPALVFAQNSMSGMSDSNKKQKMTMGPEDCSDMMVWERTSSSCIALPMAGIPMGMWMVHGNGFLVQNRSEGPRGRDRFSAPHMLMADVGHSYGNNYFNADVMLTFERWTFPKDGNPLLLQIGEVNEDNQPYIDGQHPHSSPIMGLTFSDTIRLGEGKDYLKIFFAPRGQATEGPIAFMHRPTGMVNPDAPLGHHTAQDVSHITSTVVGASAALGRFQIEGSVFNGSEPEPSKVDLPIGTLNSYATRLGYQFSDSTFVMISASQVDPSDANHTTMTKAQRYSASAYTKHEFGENWMLHNTLIYGQLNNHEDMPVLKSYGEEFLFHKLDTPHYYWGRIEFVERTAMQLAVMTTTGADDPKMVTALTAGYTYKINFTDLEAGVGGLITKDFLPNEFKDTYGGDPLSGKIFIQISGMKMGQL